MSGKNHKYWTTYSGGSDRPGEHCYNFLISNDLTQLANFPTWIPQSTGSFNQSTGTIIKVFYYSASAFVCCLQQRDSSESIFFLL